MLLGVLNTQDVMRSRVHVRMLAGDYPCAAYAGNDKSCKLCRSLRPHDTAPVEDMFHLLTRCRATADTRDRILPDLFNIIFEFYPHNQLLTEPNQAHITQFVLDPTSLNLPVNIRISPNSPNIQSVMCLCRHLCFALHKDRTRQLKNLTSTSF